MTVSLEPTQLTPVKKLDPANIEIADLDAHSRYGHQQSPLHWESFSRKPMFTFRPRGGGRSCGSGIRSGTFVPVSFASHASGRLRCRDSRSGIADDHCSVRRRTSKSAIAGR